MANKLEFVLPVRAAGQSALDYTYERGAAVREYENRMAHAMDKFQGAGVLTTDPKPALRSGDKYTGAERRTNAALTLHDYLADRPMLLARYKQIGAAALFEL